MNIYCTQLYKNSAGWTVASPVRVNNDPLISGNQPDQFIPAAAVDARGRIHVIFYDNRNYCTGGCGNTVMFDEYYAISIDHGATFANYNLRTGSDPAQVATQQGFAPHEYNGIDVSNNSETAEIWMSYQGTVIGLPGVIYGSHVSVTF
jgi:hypothetical protein